MRASESPFESYKSKRILFFANLICSSVPGPKALKKGVCVLPYSIALKVTEHFRNRIKKMLSDRTKIALRERKFRKKKFADMFLLMIC